MDEDTYEHIDVDDHDVTKDHDDDGALDRAISCISAMEPKQMQTSKEGRKRKGKFKGKQRKRIIGKHPQIKDKYYPAPGSSLEYYVPPNPEEDEEGGWEAATFVSWRIDSDNDEVATLQHANGKTKIEEKQRKEKRQRTDDNNRREEN